MVEEARRCRRGIVGNAGKLLSLGIQGEARKKEGKVELQVKRGMKDIDFCLLTDLDFLSIAEF